MTELAQASTRPEGRSSGEHALAKGTWKPVALAMFASAWGGNEFTPLLVMYRQNGGLSEVAVDALLFTYVLGIVPALMIGGPLSDRFGRRPLMLPAPVFAALGSLLLALGPNSLTLLSAGRICSGVALGLAMAVGGSWIAELSVREGGSAAAGAKRAAMSLTAGFGIGAGLAGVLAQWAPWREVLPYAVNIALVAVAFTWLCSTPETRGRAERGTPQPSESKPTGSKLSTSLLADLKIRGVFQRRFLLVVLPIAPWVFGSAASAYAVIPALMAATTAGAPIAFAGLCCIVGLAAGFAVQSVGRKIDVPGAVRGPVVALVILAIGMALSVLASIMLTVWVSLAAAIVLGCGYGMAMISGLLEVQRMASPDNLAGITAVFYGATYLGFALPAIFAWTTQTWESVTYPMIFGFGVIAAFACLAVVLIGGRHGGHHADPGHSADSANLDG